MFCGESRWTISSDREAGSGGGEIADERFVYTMGLGVGRKGARLAFAFYSSVMKPLDTQFLPPPRSLPFLTLSLFHKIANVSPKI